MSIFRYLRSKRWFQILSNNNSIPFDFSYPLNRITLMTPTY